MTASIFLDVARGLREGGFMFCETLWALILGFGLSGAVRTYATRGGVERRLGNHRPAAVGRAGLFGMASSSCSYAASALAKSMIQKGADFTSAMVFMFASTNLVIELGIVLAVLMGWQFAAAEFAGGTVMIVLLALAGGLVISPNLVERARRRIAMEGEDDDHTEPEPAHNETRRVARAKTAWGDVASYAIGDLKMLRRELLGGYVVAGLLATLVPNRVWSSLFLHGRGSWTAIENALVAPVIAFVSCVCSVGNVPMAAALWHGGISFGGVASFLFADLVAAPLVLVYRRYYGWRLTAQLVGLFWAVMSLAGLFIGEIFQLGGIEATRRPVRIVATSFHWDYTTVLDLAFLLIGLLGYLAYRARARAGGVAFTAIDPVCGMQVQRASAPVSAIHRARRYYFCSEHCAARFKADTEHYLGHDGTSALAASPDPPHR